MREYDLKKALSTGSYTRNSIKPQLLVAEDGEYRQGDILDANATMEVVSSTASDIDDKINDILGVDNGAVQELVGILSDSDTTTGILNELAKKANISDLETVVGDIPQVPTNVSAFTNDAGYLTQHQDISGKANSSDLSTVATSGSYNDLSNKPNLANVATSGSYEDLSNKPHIPEDPVQSDWAEDDTTDQAYIKNKPNLATVATSGSYNDLIDKPAAIGQVQSDWLEADTTDPAYIKNKPNIPNAQIQSDWAQDDNTQADYIKNKPNIPAEQIQSDWNQSDTTAKDYIKNKPDIPTRLSDLIDDISSDVPQQQSTNEKGHNFVEIGGVKWATMNLGANNETDYGLYFQWGDTQGYAPDQIGTGEGQKYFVEDNYKFYRKGTGYTGSTVNDYSTKYCRYDRKAVLDLSDDAANVMWGGSWRIPTALDFKKLLDATTNQWVTNYNDSGINGILFTGKQNTSDSGKTLFFPAASGYFQGTHSYFGNENENGYYFSRDVQFAEDSQTSNRAYSLTFNQNSVQVGSNERFAAIVIRPVIESKPKDNSNNCEYVDLGLPSGLLWAKRNVTRNNQNPYDTSSYRNLFSWGNIDNCDHCLSGQTAYSASNGAKLTGNIPADSKYDAVRCIMGGDWRMPTKKEAQELIDNCTFSCNDGIITATSNINGNSIIFSGDVWASDEHWYTSSLFTMIWLSDIYDDTKAYRLHLGVSQDDQVNVNVNVGQLTRYIGTYIHGVLDSVKPITNQQNDENQLQDLKQEISNSFEILKKPEPNTNAHEYVDLGLPSNKLWAKCNIGAQNESDFGLYFQWGDTQGYTLDQCGTEEGKKAFKWSDYKYGDGTDDLSGTGLSKYNQTDKKSVLDSEDDPASVVWGGNWRTPTKAEYEELLTYTTWEDVVINNMRGLKCVSIYDKSKYIFIPFSGICYDGQFSWGSYTLTGTTSTLNTENSTSKYKTSYAWDTFNHNMYSVSRYCGTTIRAILDGYPNQTSVVAATGDYNDLINKPSSATIRKIELTQNLVDQTTTISGQSNDGKREIVIYDNNSQNNYTVSVSTAYKTLDGDQITLSVPPGCYCEVYYINIGGTIFAKGIKQQANS